MRRLEPCSVRKEAKNMQADSRARTKRRTPKTRERILVESASLFSKQGYIGTSTGQIAEAVGITQPGVYRHFRSKNDIVLALAEAILNPLTDIAEREKRLNHSSSVELARFVRGMCYELAYSDFSAQFFISGQYNSPEFKPVSLQYRRLTRYLEGLIRRGIKNGEFRSVPVATAQETIMSLTDIVIFPASGKPRDRIHHVVEVAVRGLLADLSSIDAILAEAYFDKPA